MTILPERTEEAQPEEVSSSSAQPHQQVRGHEQLSRTTSQTSSTQSMSDVSSITSASTSQASSQGNLLPQQQPTGSTSTVSSISSVGSAREPQRYHVWFEPVVYQEETEAFVCSVRKKRKCVRELEKRDPGLKLPAHLRASHQSLRMSFENLRSSTTSLQATGSISSSTQSVASAGSTGASASPSPKKSPKSKVIPVPYLLDVMQPPPPIKSSETADITTTGESETSERQQLDSPSQTLQTQQESMVTDEPSHEQETSVGESGGATGGASTSQGVTSAEGTDTQEP